MKTMLSVTRDTDVTTVKFFEEGKQIAILEEEKLTEEILDIHLRSEKYGDGRIVCTVIGDQLSMIGNLSTITWINRCKVHLRIPL